LNAGFVTADNSVYPRATLVTIFEPSMGIWRMLVVEDSEPVIYVDDDDKAVRDSLKLLLEPTVWSSRITGRVKSSRKVMWLAGVPAYPGSSSLWG